MLKKEGKMSLLTTDTDTDSLLVQCIYQEDLTTVAPSYDR